MNERINKTLSNANVLSICLLAIVWIAETSLLLSWQEMTTGVCNRISSSLNGLKRKQFQNHNSKRNRNYSNKSLDSPNLITCNAQEPAHWHPFLYHAYYSDSNPQIVDLESPYRSNEESETAISALILLFSAAIAPIPSLNNPPLDLKPFRNQ